MNKTSVYYTNIRFRVYSEVANLWQNKRVQLTHIGRKTPGVKNLPPQHRTKVDDLYLSVVYSPLKVISVAATQVIVLIMESRKKTYTAQ